MKYQYLFSQKNEMKMLSSADVIDALRVKLYPVFCKFSNDS